MEEAELPIKLLSPSLNQNLICVFDENNVHLFVTIVGSLQDFRELE